MKKKVRTYVDGNIIFRNEEKTFLLMCDKMSMWVEFGRRKYFQFYFVWLLLNFSEYLI